MSAHTARFYPNPTNRTKFTKSKPKNDFMKKNSQSSRKFDKFDKEQDHKHALLTAKKNKIDFNCENMRNCNFNVDTLSMAQINHFIASHSDPGTDKTIYFEKLDNDEQKRLMFELFEGMAVKCSDCHEQLCGMAGGHENFTTKKNYTNLLGFLIDLGININTLTPELLVHINDYHYKINRNNISDAELAEIEEERKSNQHPEICPLCCYNVDEVSIPASIGSIVNKLSKYGCTFKSDCHCVQPKSKNSTHGLSALEYHLDVICNNTLNSPISDISYGVLLCCLEETPSIKFRKSQLCVQPSDEDGTENHDNYNIEELESIVAKMNPKTVSDLSATGQHWRDFIIMIAHINRYHSHKMIDIVVNYIVSRGGVTNINKKFMPYSKQVVEGISYASAINLEDPDCSNSQTSMREGNQSRSMDESLSPSLRCSHASESDSEVTFISKPSSEDGTYSDNIKIIEEDLGQIDNMITLDSRAHPIKNESQHHDTDLLKTDYLKKIKNLEETISQLKSELDGKDKDLKNKNTIIKNMSLMLKMYENAQG